MTKSLIGLRVENYKRIELVDVTFDPAGGAVAIMGQNEAGKTSLLDALESLIAGRKAPKATKPVHKNAPEARIIGTFDDLVVTRVYKPNGTTSIKVQDTNGRAFTGADDIIRRLYSQIAVDPFAFSRLNDADQVATLLPMIGFDPAPLDAAHDAAYAERTIVKRELDKLTARLEAMPEDANAPRQFVDVGALSDELAVALGSVARRRELDAAVDVAADRLARDRRRVDELRRELTAAEQNVEAAIVDGREAASRADGFAVIDPEPIRKQLSEAEEVNDRFRTASARAAIVFEHEKVKDAWETVNAQVARTKTDKLAALAEAAARMPVPGLSLDPESNSLTLNGYAFSDASTAVKIRTGTSIAMKLNPDFRAIIIRDASLLDQGNRNVIDELAKEHGFLVLMEIADENSAKGVVIEDGLVREVRA